MSETGLGCSAWWSDPEWEQADALKQKRYFVSGELYTFNPGRLTDESAARDSMAQRQGN
jgi:hypothetical protein